MEQTPCDFEEVPETPSHQKQHMTPLHRALHETEQEISMRSREINRVMRSIDYAYANGQAWRVKDLGRSLPALDERHDELRSFRFYLKQQYAQELAQGELDEVCSCGLFISSTQERCMECGKPVCTLHSLPRAEMKGHRRRVIGRICDDCQEYE